MRSPSSSTTGCVTTSPSRDSSTSSEASTCLPVQQCDLLHHPLLAVSLHLHRETLPHHPKPPPAFRYSNAISFIIHYWLCHYISIARLFHIIRSLHLPSGTAMRSPSSSTTGCVTTSPSRDSS